MSATRRLLIGSALTALVVGTVLTLVNQWEAIRSARFDALLRPTAFNYAVPFFVSLYSRWRTRSAVARSAGATHGVGK